MFKSLFLLAMVTMPMTAFSQLPDGGIPVTLRAQTAAGVNKTAGFSSSIKKAELSTDIITEKPEGEEYTHCDAVASVSIRKEALMDSTTTSAGVI